MTVSLEDPEDNLADCARGTRRIEYRVRQTDNDFLYWNGRALNGPIPSSGFGVTFPPCP